MLKRATGLAERTERVATAAEDGSCSACAEEGCNRLAVDLHPAHSPPVERPVGPLKLRHYQGVGTVDARAVLAADSGP